MLSEVMDYFGLEQELDHLGHFETDEQAHLFKELQKIISQGRLIVLSGVIGCGKTTTLQRLVTDLAQSKKIIVSRSLAVDKERVNLGTLITALFYDLSTEKELKLPTQPEKRERMLLALIQKRRKPVALFVDDAHGLHHKTLVGLKRLVELVRFDGGLLSVILAGHPKLKNDLRRPTLEEIGGRTTVFALEGIHGHQREYIEWLLHQATGEKTQYSELLSEEALVLLSQRLTTPLQIESGRKLEVTSSCAPSDCIPQQYLTLAFEEAYRVGQKPITPEIIETTLAQGLEDLEPRLIRHGYNAKNLAELLNVRTAEMRSFLHGQLPPGRTQDLRDQMLKIGIPLSAS